MVAAAAISAVATVGGAAISSSAAGHAANTQANATLQATNSANELQRYFFDVNREDLAPWRTAGEGALNQLTQGTGVGGEFRGNFTRDDFLNNMDPAYQFNLEQGQKALERSAAAQGSFMSGGTLKELTRYGQGMASNEFGNAYNRWMNTRQSNFSNLAQLAGFGSNATATGVQSGTNAGNNMSANTIAGITGAGNARAAGIMGQGNAFGNAFSSIGSNVSQYMMLQQLMNRGA